MVRSVLVLDSSPLMFDQYRSCLNGFACDLNYSRHADEALRLAENQAFDLIFTEIDLPDISGFEFVQRLQLAENRQRCPIIAITSPADDWMLKRMRASGFYAFLAKPLQQDNVIRLAAPFIGQEEPSYAVATGVSR